MNFLKRLFHTGKTEETKDPDMKRFLIACLGNMGPEYVNTRHNAGFMVADALADDAGVSFQSKRYGDMAVVRVKNCELLILKPSTFMNLSGVAVRYWMNHEKLPPLSTTWRFLSVRYACASKVPTQAITV